MDKLLQHYERELGRLRQATRQYAEAHPETAAALELGPDASTDPEVERLLQSVALLNADMQQCIEEGRSEFHKALLQTLQPHYLRPVPACGIVQVDTSAARANQVSSVTRLPRGSILCAGACKFTTAYEVCITPIAITSARFHPTIDLPATLRLPSEATSDLILSLETTAGSVSFDQPPLCQLRICIDGEPELRAQLLDAILMHRLRVCMETESGWQMLEKPPFTSVGTQVQDALFPINPGSQSPRLLAEFFHFPQMSDFIDLDLAAISSSCPPGCKRIALHIVLAFCEPQLHRAVAANFRLACTPVVNLFSQGAESIRLDGRSSAYPVAPIHAGCEIYSIDHVAIKSRYGDKPVPPFHGLQHVDSGPYWQLDDQEGAAIHFVDREQRPLKLETGTVAVQLTCMNSALPNYAAKVVSEAGAGGFPIQFVGGLAQSSSLSGPSAICDGVYADDTSLPALRNLLRLHGCKFTESLKDLIAKPSTAWLEHPMGRVHMHGTEFTLLVDEPALRGHSIHALGEVLAITLADKLRQNRFSRLRIANENGTILYLANPLPGTRPLL